MIISGKGLLYLALLHHRQENIAFVWRCYRPLFAHSSCITCPPPSVELVPLAQPCDMYSKQHMEAALMGQQHPGNTE